MLLDLINTSNTNTAPTPVDTDVLPEASGILALVDAASAVTEVDVEAVLGIDDETEGDKPEVSPRNHIEVTAGCTFAAVSDIGLRHHDNQDSVAISAVEILVSPVDVPPVYIAVICDGVSSSEFGASASSVAVQSVAKDLNAAFTRNPCANPRGELFNAIRRANEAVCAIPVETGSEKDPPSTTIVAAVVQDGFATIAWVGDSRAYWVTEDDAGVLTRDDSWINAMLDAGYMTEEEALVSPNQSALYRCLGGELCEDGPNADPSFANLYMAKGTRLILCSDGFWNYAPTPEDVGKLVRQTPAEDAFVTAKHLVNFAIVGGGHDNITVTVLSL